MDSIGAEVGHKMRSAIKAKLMELDCYVDEELPDYIMVMVANRRSKSQMTEDLNLFLSAKTSTFVNWLHIVLKKLKEVTVTNPEVYQKALKRKNDVPVDDKSSLKVKKEKSHKKIKNEEDVSTSMTDDLPISNLAKNRKIIVESCKDSIVDDNFDIPLLSEVADSVNEQELQDIEKKIKSVKSRLGLLVDSDEEVKNENGGAAEITSTKQHQIEAEPSVSEEGSNKPKHKRITFENEPVLSRSRDKSPNNQSASGRKPSILDRLGKRPGRDAKATINRDDRTSSRDKSSVSSRLGYRKGEGSSRYRNDSRSRSRSPLDSRSHKNDTDGQSIKEGILSRLGVQSKVAVVKKAPPEPDNEEEEQVVREVQSSIKVKPRVIPSDAVQPNKNLLLKAVAEAQRSVAQTPKVGKEPSKITSLDKIKNNILHRLSPKPNARDLIKKSSDRMRSRLQLSSEDDDYDSEGEYVPKSVGSKLENVTPIYVTSANHSQSNSQHNDLATNDKQQFIITLDGIENTGFISKLSAETLLREDGTVNKRVPSPIVFNKTEISATEIVTTRPDIPDVLPVVRPPLSVKNKERCKYWPGCKHGDRCEFVHPSESCQLFPHCKFGDRCIFLHPKCKFAASCTKRDCPYDHVTNKLIPASKVTATPSMQNCKFFPNCTNPKCQFYHPKPCKYGKFCNNMATCTFSHPTANNRKNFSWTAK